MKAWLQLVHVNLLFPSHQIVMTTCVILCDFFLIMWEHDKYICWTSQLRELYVLRLGMYHENVVKYIITCDYLYTITLKITSNIQINMMGSNWNTSTLNFVSNILCLKNVLIEPLHPQYMSLHRQHHPKPLPRVKFVSGTKFPGIIYSYPPYMVNGSRQKCVVKWCRFFNLYRLKGGLYVDTGITAIPLLYYPNMPLLISVHLFMWPPRI